ncbi:glycosyltransferase family 4 protein [Olivibacter ginsenosidimutans]|uniref:Glycosyltransferase family 4 protein n=1 Tax=Olivibacter ginsenosidimutans TaxID=1176537 RepID=A0ABP9AEX8_9SPHI
MKILYINALYSPFIQGGAEISLKTLVEGIQAAGHEVVVLSLKPDGSMTVDQEDGVKVYRAPLKNSYWPFVKTQHPKWDRLLWHVRDQHNSSMQKAVREVLAQEKPDVVSCHNLVGWSIAVWEEIKRAHLPIVQVLHDLYLLCPNSDMFKDDHSCTKQCLRCSLLRHKHRKASAQVDAMIGISQFILQRFTQHGYFEQAQKQVIYNTREIPASPLPPERQANDVFRIGYIGTLAQKKGVEWLIEQFSQVSIKASLHIAGGGKKSYEHFLRGLATDQRITFVGYVDPNTFYDNIDLLVVPSLWEEPLGMVAIEALAHHVPVIATNKGGLPETVKHEINGLICDPSEKNSLAHAIQRLYEDLPLYRTLVQQARNSVSEILDKQRLLNAYTTIYGNLKR